jgi:hypothetical protein
MRANHAGGMLCGMTAPAQLLVYRFRTAGFEGRLVGALERLEAGGALRVLDILFVGSDQDTGELFAIDLHSSSASGMVGSLIGFRLDLSERRRTTQRALAREDGASQLIRDLGETLGQGDALVAVLVGHEWARTLADAVERTGGSTVADAFVETTKLVDLAGDLLSAARAPTPL